MLRQLNDEFRILGLRSNATFAEVKASYRRLARRYHPDLNPGDRSAHDKFIRITQAYQYLVNALPMSVTPHRTVPTPAPQPFSSPVPPRHPAATKVTVEVNPNLSTEEQALKQRGFEQLQTLVRGQRFPRAIALVDGLAQRLADDAEVRQWQAITYQRWARYLIRHGHHEKARRALKKALRIDPHNQALWKEVNRDLERLEDNLSQQKSPASV